jgi:type I restriction enzyme S subunit
MIADLKPYPEYKESGLPWLGRVPEHWSKERAKWLFTKMDRPVRDDDDVVTCFRDGMVTLRKNRRLRGFTEAIYELGYQGIRKGDLIIHAMDAFAGAVGVSDSDGKATPVYAVCQPKPEANAHYYAFIVREMARSQWILALSRGIRERSTDFRYETFGRQRVPLPPTDEQVTVVRFLNRVNGRLERAIRAKQKVMALLNEQKQSIIHRAVIRGIDPSVQFKPSGIPWIGDIPQRWAVRRAKYIYREVDDRSAAGSEELLSVSHITGVTPRSQKSITMFKAASYAGHKLCRPGDLAVNTMWAWMGALGVSTYDGIISPGYAVYRPLKPDGIVGRYVDGLLRSRPYISNIICHSTGVRASRLRLYPEEFLRLPIIQPPFEEQQQIVQAFESETADASRQISRLEREIALLREYRIRLVADVVTGKLDVREAAACLPDEAPEATEDETDPSIDPEAVDEEAVV